MARIALAVAVNWRKLARKYVLPVEPRQHVARSVGVGPTVAKCSFVEALVVSELTQSIIGVFFEIDGLFQQPKQEEKHATDA